ncbi:MAG: GTP pyrophosphokinase family protein [Dehalococcoidia bacterium]
MDIDSSLDAGAPLAEFDFAAHRRVARESFEAVRGQYDSFRLRIHPLIEQALGYSQIKTASIDSRTKDVESFAEKAGKPSDDDPNAPKYPKPLDNITDLIGIRVIVFLLDDVEKVRSRISQELEVVEIVDKGELLRKNDTLGYQSLHLLCKLKSPRVELFEYVNFRDFVVEFQIRTVLQHAWAEIEHDIQYKSLVALPEDIRRRFLALAGLIEIADREFQSIRGDDTKIQEESSQAITRQNFETEITTSALRTYLTQTQGRDDRISYEAYAVEATLLRRLGFRTFAQIEICTSGYDGEKICRSIWGNRQGPVWRFRVMVMLGMGDVWRKQRPWDSLINAVERAGETLGMHPKNYDPRAED